MANISQGRYLVTVNEALGLSYNQILTSSYTLIETMIQEYAYMTKERNKSANGDPEEKGEWIELPSFDDPTKLIRMRKYDDIAGKINAEKNL